MMAVLIYPRRPAPSAEKKNAALDKFRAFVVAEQEEDQRKYGALQLGKQEERRQEKARRKKGR